MDKASPRRWELWILVALLLIAAALRATALTDVPPGLRYDELLNYRMAGRVLAGDRPLYFAESWGHEPLFHYAQAASMALMGQSAWSLRLPAVVCGLLSVLTTWLAARRLFGARVASLAAAGLSISFWSIFYSREGSRVIGVAPLFSLMAYFLWRGVERLNELPHTRPPWRATTDFVMAGLCAGCTFYIYVAGRVSPLLATAFALYLALFDRLSLKRSWFGLALSVAVGLALAAPLLLLLSQNPGMEQRIGLLGDAWAALKGGDPLPVLSLTARAAGMFVWRGEKDWLFNVYGRPIFGPLTAVCFLLGIALCIRRRRQARFAFLLLWLLVGVSPACVVPPAASLTHTIAAQPPAYILVAVGLAALWRTARRYWKWGGALLAVGLLLTHGALSGHAYFVTWVNAPEVRELYQGGVTAVARDLESLGGDLPGPVAVGAPYVNYWHPWNAVAFDLTSRQEELEVRWFNPAGAWVWPAGTGPTTYYFPTDPLGPQTFDPALEALFAADATPLPAADEDFAAFRVAHPAALEERLGALESPAPAWPPDLAHLPPPTLPLDFGGRFALVGAELDEETIPAGGELRLTTYWETLAADPAPVVAFAHLTSDGQDIWGQHDWLDVWADGLQRGDRFIQVHRVPVDPSTPPGLYRIQLGLYGPDTLLRLPIATGMGEAADRVWIGQVQVAER